MRVRDLFAVLARDLKFSASAWNGGSPPIASTTSSRERDARRLFHATTRGRRILRRTRPGWASKEQRRALRCPKGGNPSSDTARRRCSAGSGIALAMTDLPRAFSVRQAIAARVAAIPRATARCVGAQRAGASHDPTIYPWGARLRSRSMYADPVTHFMFTYAISKRGLGAEEIVAQVFRNTIAPGLTRGGMRCSAEIQASLHYVEPRDAVMQYPSISIPAYHPSVKAFRLAPCARRRRLPTCR